MKHTTKKSEKKFKSGRYEAYQGRQVWFQSDSKADRYLQLVNFVNNKLITDLELCPKYNAIIHNVKVCTFIPDFRYMTLEPNEHRGYTVVEDVKKVSTDIYSLRKLLVELSHGIKIHTINPKEIDEWKEIIPLNQ
tara:strand:+ start:1294 stop:1698 length:405 start_codon:yes stop_codon:yes gene_type:complete